MKSSTLVLVLFFAFIITTGIALYANSAKGETGICSEKTAANADTLRICLSPAMESAIARGNQFAAEMRVALYALRDGDDPEFQIPNLATYVIVANLTLENFGVTHEDLVNTVNRYYAAKVREIDIYALKDDKEKLAAAFSQIYDIYEKRDALFLFMRDNLAAY